MGGTIDLEYFKDLHLGKNYTSVPKGELGSLDNAPLMLPTPRGDLDSN